MDADEHGFFREYWHHPDAARKYLPTCVIAPRAEGARAEASRQGRRSNLKFHPKKKSIRDACQEIASAAQAASQ